MVSEESVSSSTHILIVEDEIEMAELLRKAVTEEGYEYDTAPNGAIGLTKARRADLLLVDVMMPVMNGFEMVQKLREAGSRTPIIFLTAKDATKDLVHGLGLGADDFLVKPFKLDELIARIKAALRRSRDTSHLLKWNDVVLDCAKRTAFRGGAELFLSSTEFVLFETFLRRPGLTLSKTVLLEEVWRDEGYRSENIVEVYVSYLRRKCEARGASRIIHTMKGIGYVLALAEPKS